MRTNPVTGSRWLNGVDPTGEQIRTAARALAAQAEFAKMAPAGTPPLPLSNIARERLKVGGVAHIVAWFAGSLSQCDYDFGKHPWFEPYARAVLASPYAPDFIINDAALQQKFPPLPLKGLGSGLCSCFEPAPIRKATPWQQRIFLNDPPPPQGLSSHSAVARQDADVVDWYVPNSNALQQLDDEFVAHATKLALYKRLPSGWDVHKPAEMFTRRIGGYQLWTIKIAYGWLIEREHQCGKEEVLANILSDFPVLCETYVTAARLAEAAHRGLPDQYLLTWISTT